MATHPTREIWHIHLSTAVLLSLLVGWLLLANIHLYERLTIAREVYGWPLKILEVEKVQHAAFFPRIEFEPMNYEALIADAIICLILLVAVVVISEAIIRWRKRGGRE